VVATSTRGMVMIRDGGAAPESLGVDAIVSEKLFRSCLETV